MNIVDKVPAGLLRSWLHAGAALVLCVVSSALYAEEGIKDDAKKAGRAVGSVVHDIGQGAKKVGKEIGQGAKKVGKAIGEAAKEGGREFKQAVKGE